MFALQIVPLFVPADAEYAIEGYVPPYGARKRGRPSGEFTDGYSRRRRRIMMRKDADRCRNDAIYHVILAGGTAIWAVYAAADGKPTSACFGLFEKSVISGTPRTYLGCVASSKRPAMNKPAQAMLAAFVPGWVQPPSTPMPTRMMPMRVMRAVHMAHAGNQSNT